MRKLWKDVMLYIHGGRRYKIFLILCVMIPGTAGLILTLLWGLTTGKMPVQIVENLFILAGYSGLGGFLAGILYLYNHD